jgi:membrane-associated phospholipid phosphatase
VTETPAAPRAPIAVIAGLIAATLLLGIVVRAGVGGSAERAMMHAMAFREDRTPDALIAAARWISWFGNTEQRTILVMLFSGWLVWKKRSLAALVVAVVPALTLVLTSALKEMFDRARPTIVPRIDQVTELSFPSGHASNAAATFVLLALVLPGQSPRMRMALAITGAVLIGWSRVALGVHWPSDVVGGWLLGIAFALIGFHLVRKSENKA